MPETTTESAPGAASAELVEALRTRAASPGGLPRPVVDALLEGFAAMVAACGEFSTNVDGEPTSVRGLMEEISQRGLRKLPTAQLLTAAAAAPQSADRYLITMCARFTEEIATDAEREMAKVRSAGARFANPATPAMTLVAEIARYVANATSGSTLALGQLAAAAGDLDLARATRPAESTS
ncbi:hypothetical protein [Amycolatopsis anabasis]|uniref:hypothetical protein n=1 Tax=Amycolatopsis anabasis TaxID=1840409 RepID=UPI00131BD6CE|nr:hypothetical protein [Amycolatopsis anabasis]